jgi:hypothetical protein
VSTVADDYSARRDVAKLTIELATPRSRKSPAPDDWFATKRELTDAPFAAGPTLLIGCDR